MIPALLLRRKDTELIYGRTERLREPALSERDSGAVGGAAEIREKPLSSVWTKEVFW